MKQKVYFRADGNADIGWGHVTRTLVIARQLRNDFENIFVTRFLNDYISDQARMACDTVIELEDSADHLSDFIQELQKDDIVVLDNYFYSTDDQRKIKDKGCKLVMVDDMHDKHFVADLVINHSHGISPEDYSKESYTKLLLGLKYALIRPEFHKPIPQKNENNQNTFICFGGSRYAEKTIDFAESILAHTHGDIHIVIGGSEDIFENLKSKFSDERRINIHFNLNAEQMVSIMDLCYYAIVPSSSMLIETLYRGLKVITGYFVDNQKLIYAAMTKDKHAIGIGYLDEIKDLGQTLSHSLVQVDEIVSINHLKGNGQNLLEEFKLLSR
ncbi:MAG: UDP-2,4-diacetamido-2,4,6-trideoxy-beta-L-altropyranose hydrolase [Flavobacteriales bacterium]|nr:UDP-2,4-diacetamido-2,4,6-trideoxy-beta-L-altropyranose hydrolase [Flavobacteriales bacterium]